MRFSLYFRRFGIAALDALLPPRCMVCDAAVGKHGDLCGTCFAAASFITAPFCVRCGIPFASADQSDADGMCQVCRNNPPTFRHARAALRYNDLARRLILPLKHADRVDLAPILAPMMMRAGADLITGSDVLVPVPLHRRRLYDRKYNQAALLAQVIARRSGRPALLDALRRTRVTASLDHKTADQRAIELQGAITVPTRRQARIGGRTILLIDDVMTSGATCNACAISLLAAGASAVDVLVAARVPDPRLS